MLKILKITQIWRHIIDINNQKSKFRYEGELWPNSSGFCHNSLLEMKGNASYNRSLMGSSLSFSLSGSFVSLSCHFHCLDAQSQAI